jgi:hypothetical protein
MQDIKQDDIIADTSHKILTKPTALSCWCKIDLNAKFLLTLTNNKWPLGIAPGGHHFVVLNVSINKKPIFVSEVVTYGNPYYASALPCFPCRFN